MGKEGKPSPLDMFMKQQEDCDRPACEDTVNALNSALSRLNMKSGGDEKKSVKAKVECPPSKSLLGDSSWNLLHSMVAWYPDRPTMEQQTKMKNFMEALAMFYPCSYCAADFQENQKQSPVKTETREDLCIWLCEQHNLVNEKLGKKLFKCDMKSLDERWRKSSDPDCNK
jgi:FAD-linked sulfhydryl oxidase